MIAGADEQTQVKEILARLSRWGSRANLEGMARYGIDTSNAYGVPLSRLRGIARGIRRDHSLAMALWETGNREARVVAFLIADPAALTRPQMNRWARQSGSWDICDGCCIHLFRKSPLAWDRARSWTRQSPEFVKRAGFALLASLVVHDKQAPDERFAEMLPVIEEAAGDGRNFVRKAVNWALRTIGKRNGNLRIPAIETARRLASRPEASARWIGRDALRELESRAPARQPQVKRIARRKK